MGDTNRGEINGIPKLIPRVMLECSSVRDCQYPGRADRAGVQVIPRWAGSALKST